MLRLFPFIRKKLPSDSQRIISLLDKRSIIIILSKIIIFGKYTILKHFEPIKRFLHFSNNDEFDPANHPYPKLNKI